ncbi:MAG: sigma-70 family RNA polymerase sigma factor [Deltaproteobacteria bacterium]|nr:sigma-70 family RNA polymerase sigma factor [Deltaproteobacteria bacterium]
MDARRRQFEAQTLPLLDGLYAAGLRISGTRAEAEDLVQETYLHAWQAWDRFEAGTNVRAWMHRILVNAYISQYRRRRRERRALDVDADPGRRELFLSSAQSAVEGSDGGVQVRALSRGTQAALDALPVEFRAVVVMADLSEMSYREIAEAMRCPVGTVMSRLHRARRALARTLGEAMALPERKAA